MVEQRVIENGNIRLEANLVRGDHDGGVVITHPHPLYGGNMYNPVVGAVAGAFQSLGWTTLCFNFRGTGKSTGMYDDGRGEQTDVLACLDLLADMGCRQRILAGYSFGSWVNAGVMNQKGDIMDHIMVSPPAAFISFDTITRLPDTGLIITGENDTIAPPDVIAGYIKKWQITPQFDILPGVDHFYGSGLDLLSGKIVEYLRQLN